MVTSSNAFYLAGPAIAGPFEYRLYRSGIDGNNENSWYLRSFCPPENPNCSVEPGPPTPPAPPLPFFPIPYTPGSTPEYRQEVGLYPVLPAMTILYGQALIDTLHERMGQGKWPTESIKPENSSSRICGRVTS